MNKSYINWPVKKLHKHNETKLHRKKPFTLNNVGGHESGSVIVALKQAMRKISFDLQAKEIPREFLFQLSWVRRVELNAEPHYRVHHG